ncbi:universal stress protein [Pleurocapsales cyanobacterium LEGE 10410]|nr:universal stress protein [Pleurocapsales cyanobacterium LEGE 10410]
MFNKILVAIDHSAASQKVFEQALSISQAEQTNLILLHVLSTEEETSPFLSPYFVQPKTRCIHVNPQIIRRANELYEQEWELFKQKGAELLGFYAKQAIAAGVQTEFTQITGHPSSTICDFARSCGADVIVLGRRGHSGLQELFLGSVSNYVVHHAPCSVLLVQTPILTESTSAENTESQDCIQDEAVMPESI